MEWKSFFERHILERGRDYYNSALVKDIKLNNDKITAIVTGNDSYKVTISSKDNEIIDMYCTCPYAEDGYNCKHMAAVLYAYEAMSDFKLNGANKHKPTAVELVSDADEKTVREFLIKALNNDKKLLHSFVVAVRSSPDDINISSYIKRIEGIVSKHVDRHRFMDYYSAGDFIDDAVDFLSSEINGLIDKGYIMAAFEVSCSLFKKIADVDMDDSDGGLSYFGDEMLNTWLRIVRLADDKQKQEMFDNFLSYLNGRVIDYMEDYIEKIVFDGFDEPEYLKRKLKFVDDTITGLDDDWRKNHWVFRRIQLMEQMDISEDEFLAYCKRYYSENDVRTAVVEYYLNREKTQEAISVLEDSLENYTTGIIAKGELHAQLKKLYKKTGNDKKYREHLWTLVTEHCNLDYFRELRTITPDVEWQTVRARVFQANSSYVLMQLYYEEKLYDRLIAELEKIGRPMYDLKYEDVLNKLYPKRMLKLYANYLNHQATGSAKRSTYAYWADELRHMLTIEGSKEIVSEMIADWKNRYKNRPAMMQELKSVKI